MIWPGSPQGFLLLRTCARSRKDLLEDDSQIFTRSSQKDLYTVQDHARICGSISLGSSQHISTRTCARLQPRSSYTTGTSKSESSNSCTIVTHGACAVLHMDMSEKQILCEKLQEKCRAPRSQRTVCERLRCPAHGHVTRAVLCENLEEECRPPGYRSAHFVRGCAVLHMDMSQEPSPARIYRKNA